MIAYLTTDSLPDIVAKNKQNIEYLIGEFSSGGISYKELVAKVEANTQAVTKAVADAASAQATADEAKAKTLTNEQAITAANTAIRANANAIAAAVVNINANTAAIARILNNGIGGYLGTFTAADGDDFTVLPKTAKDAERAITEFPRGTDIYYQEWVWNDPDGWTKLGTPTDSHIHSQSAGISLADVAAQQDPKIQKALEAAKADATVKATAAEEAAKNHTNSKFALYEEKEIVIPAPISTVIYKGIIDFTKPVNTVILTVDPTAEIKQTILDNFLSGWGSSTISNVEWKIFYINKPDQFSINIKLENNIYKISSKTGDDPASNIATINSTSIISKGLDQKETFLIKK